MGSDGSDLDTTEFVYPNGTVTIGPELPSPKRSHCMVTLKDGRIMFVGGNYNDGPIAVRDVTVYDPVTRRFTPGPSTIEDRWWSGCALFKSPAHGGRPVVISVGQKAEVFDYTSASSWESSITTSTIEIIYSDVAMTTVYILKTGVIFLS